MDAVFFRSFVVGVRTVSCLCQVASPIKKCSWFHFWFAHPEPSITSSFLANVAIVLCADCFETHGCNNGANIQTVSYWDGGGGEGRVARQKENIRRNYLWEKKCREKEKTDFSEKQVVQGCPCSHWGCFMAAKVIIQDIIQWMVNFQWKLPSGIFLPAANIMPSSDLASAVYDALSWENVCIVYKRHVNFPCLYLLNLFFMVSQSIN